MRSKRTCSQLFPSCSEAPGTGTNLFPPDPPLRGAGNKFQFDPRNEFRDPADREQVRWSTVLPIRTVSEANTRGHWSKRAKRAAEQRAVCHMATRAGGPHPLPAIVTLTRIAPRELDDDNLRGALKAARDGVADAFGIDDRDPRVSWRYGQRRGSKGQYAVEIRIERTEDEQ